MRQFVGLARGGHEGMLQCQAPPPLPGKPHFFFNNQANVAFVPPLKSFHVPHFIPLQVLS
jgi:hypothetical protein